ncbi:MAG: GTP-binding protein [Promethearchaeota archaeon]|nr:MAG: GTP-binding protein [Candidatus Lokiarchaeota archaeon]
MKIQDYIRKNALKVVIGGDGAVGKTTIAKRLSGKFKVSSKIEMTPGVDFHSMIVESYVPIDCQLWDLGGQDQFRKLLDDFFQGATVIIFMFSVDRYSSFMNLKSWIKLLPESAKVEKFLIANKIDSLNRTVDKNHALQFARAHDMNYHEISALTGDGFDDFKEDLYKTIEYLFITKDKNKD